MTIAVTKEGVRFSVSGDMGSGNMTLKSDNTVDTKEEDRVVIDMQEPVTLNFALRYLTFFVKATPLSESVVLQLSTETPLAVEYKVGDDLGHLRFYLAPKLDDE